MRLAISRFSRESKKKCIKQKYLSYLLCTVVLQSCASRQHRHSRTNCTDCRTRTRWPAPGDCVCFFGMAGACSTPLCSSYSLLRLCVRVCVFVCVLCIQNNVCRTSCTAAEYAPRRRCNAHQMRITSFPIRVHKLRCLDGVISMDARYISH